MTSVEKIADGLQYAEEMAKAEKERLEKIKEAVLNQKILGDAETNQKRCLSKNTRSFTQAESLIRKAGRLN